MEDLSDVYNELIMEHSMNSYNKKKLENADYSEIGHNPNCGDEITLELKLNGDVIEDFCISGVNCLTYDTNELRYDTTKLYNDDGTLFSETKDDEPTIVKKMAKCRSYESEIGWYGLISTEGKIITPPMYSSIEAIGYDTYLCKFYDSTGVILNGKGERIK